jgi:hypothetical protein
LPYLVAGLTPFDDRMIVFLADEMDDYRRAALRTKR